MAVPVASAYFQRNWLPVKHDWVSCFKARHFTSHLASRPTTALKVSMENSRVCSRFASLDTFFCDFFSVLRGERDHTAIINRVSKSTNKGVSVTDDDRRYEALLTPHAYGLVLAQVARRDAVKLPADETPVLSPEGPLFVTDSSCSCAFRSSHRLPCRHIFAHRQMSGKSSFDATLADKRWTAGYSLEPTSAVNTVRVSETVYTRSDCPSKIQAGNGYCDRPGKSGVRSWHVAVQRATQRSQSLADGMGNASSHSNRSFRSTTNAQQPAFAAVAPPQTVGLPAAFADVAPPAAFADVAPPPAVVPSPAAFADVAPPPEVVPLPAAFADVAQPPAVVPLPAAFADVAPPPAVVPSPAAFADVAPPPAVVPSPAAFADVAPPPAVVPLPAAFADVARPPAVVPLPAAFADVARPPAVVLLPAAFADVAQQAAVATPLEQLTMPPVMPKRGRPKGDKLTAIGLPERCRRDGPQKFRT